MSLMELGTICQEGLGVKIVIMRNTRLGMVRELQDNHYQGVHSAVYLDGSPDFTAIASPTASPPAVCTAVRKLQTPSPLCWQTISLFCWCAT